MHFKLSTKSPQHNNPILLIHGAGESAQIWPSKLTNCTDFPVYSIDLPGHGNSDSEPLDSISDYADKLAEFIKNHNLGKVFLVGHSMGGAIAIQMGLSFPNLIEGLVLISTGARLRVLPSLLTVLEHSTFFPIASWYITKRYLADYSDRILMQKFLKIIRKTGLKTTFSDLNACNQFDMLNKIKEIEIPSLIICGESDIMTPPKYSHYLHANIKGSQIEVIKNAGHLVMLEQDEIFTRTVMTWLNSTTEQKISS